MWHLNGFPNETKELLAFNDVSNVENCEIFKYLIFKSVKRIMCL